MRDGRAAAFIDFDLALPVDPLFDIAVAARHWIPLRDPADIADARSGTELFDRFRLFTAAHGLDDDQRAADRPRAQAGRQNTIGLTSSRADRGAIRRDSVM